MATREDLTGSGIPPQPANLLGHSDSICTCAGTTIGAATLIKTKNVELVAAGSATGAILPTAAQGAQVGSPYYAFCSSSTSAVVYVPSGQYVNTVQNDTFTIAQKKAVTFLQYKLNYWSAQITA